MGKRSERPSREGEGLILRQERWGGPVMKPLAGYEKDFRLNPESDGIMVKD